MAIQYADLAAFDDPVLAAIALAPEIAARAEKDKKRRIQRRGNREPSGNPRGRPRLSDEEVESSKAKRRAYMRDLMRRKRALAI
jgi:hypothetical protein